MDEEKLAEMLIGKPALAWKMRENGYFVVVDGKGKKTIFTPTQVEAVQNKPRTRLVEARASDPKGEPAKPGRARAKEEENQSEPEEVEKAKRSYKPRTKKE